MKDISNKQVCPKSIKKKCTAYKDKDGEAWCAHYGFKVNEITNNCER